MHSRIIELSKEPIEKDNYLKEYEYYDNGFIGSIADYVDGNTNRAEDIEWFAGFLKDKGVVVSFDEEKLTFGRNVRKNFFTESYEKFKQKADELTFEQFAGSYSYELYELKSLISDRFGFYIHYYGCYYTVDEFLRMSGEDDSVWYIGGTLDYHS